jgi:hypothetical protein
MLFAIYLHTVDVIEHTSVQRRPTDVSTLLADATIKYNVKWIHVVAEQRSACASDNKHLCGFRK